MKTKEFKSINEYIQFVINHKKIIVVCCLCRKKMKIGKEWILISEDIINALEKANVASHSFCFECHFLQMEQLRKKDLELDRV